MAENYAHRRNARRAMNIAQYTPRNEKAFILGANGPDFMFFYQMYNPFRKYSLSEFGSYMHNNSTGTFLKTMFSMAKTDIQKDYCLGFLCHYSLDSLTHPYVYYVTNAYGSPFAISSGHGFFESALDSKLSLADDGTLCADYEKYIPEMDEFELNQITYLLKNAISEVYPDYSHIGQAEYNQAFKDFRTLKKFFYSPKKTKFPIAAVIEKVFGFKDGYVVSRMQPNSMEIPPYPVWENAGAGVYSVETLDELLDRADYLARYYVKKGLEYFAGVADIDAFRLTIGSAGYDTGLETE